MAIAKHCGSGLYLKKNLAVYSCTFQGHQQTGRTETANITKDDITYTAAAHCHCAAE